MDTTTLRALLLPGILAVNNEKGPRRGQSQSSASEGAPSITESQSRNLHPSGRMIPMDVVSIEEAQ